MTGRFIAVVGPSGVGKDSVMGALAARDRRLVLARRVITRPGDAGGETFDGVDAAEFEARRAAGAFALHWAAHGLHYGIPVSVEAALRAGTDVLANLSRDVLRAAQARFERFEVIHLTASHDILAQRLAARGRESPAQIERRLAQAAKPLPEDLLVHEIDNSGDLDLTLRSVLARLYPREVQA